MSERTHPAQPTPHRRQEADPFAAESSRIYAVFDEVMSSLDRLAAANPEFAGRIDQKRRGIATALQEATSPLEELSADLRVSWLRGELVQPPSECDLIGVAVELAEDPPTNLECPLCSAESCSMFEDRRGLIAHLMKDHQVELADRVDRELASATA